ncbi:MAG: ImmA/IrrE family metallo-endopeptidase [Bacteroidetes bacterium]|nr:ImmA/IrrE family metallo-endopeptidase [Bacteroidota bacterium]MBK8657874.1 ImmA/IrrE family metallo-endopeptidase [Bacteroidota bacterium]
METTTEENIRIIFGLKLKKLRTDRRLSLQELSDKSGVSVSYMNEIENGKKYPKPDKINDLAQALGTTYESLVSLKINRNLTPVVQVLNLKIINDFLFETFGVDKGLLMSMMANAPTSLSALINSVFEIARNYNLQEEHFYFSCLRSFQEMNENYFPEIEQAVESFRKEAGQKMTEPWHSKTYAQLLRTKFNYKIEETDFADYPKLKNFRSVYVPGEIPTLLYNSKLTEQQKIFLLGKEIGFASMKITVRPATTSWLKVESFDHVMNNFKAAYFAQALHINKDYLIKDIEEFFSFKKWKPEFLVHLLDKYNASPEMLFQRISNILPKYFGINELYFIRYSSKEPSKHLKEISKELHMSRNQVDLEYIISEQNYRRWITKALVRAMDQKWNETGVKKTMIDAVISQNDAGEDYLTISILRPMPELNNNANSVSIGFVITDAVKKKVAFLHDPALSFSKLGPKSELNFETPYQLRKMREEEAKQAEYNKLMQDLQA